ncbi:hypothetical protein CEQ08_04735 [Providencia rettgeri]|nr:hypothetical protein CEQ08_04735 [Providencia rettgeri]
MCTLWEVDYVQLFGSYTDVRSPRYLLLSPIHNVNYLEHGSSCARYGVLTTFSSLGHILMYAPQDVFSCRLSTM